MDAEYVVIPRSETSYESDRQRPELESVSEFEASCVVGILAEDQYVRSAQSFWHDLHPTGWLLTTDEVVARIGGEVGLAGSLVVLRKRRRTADWIPAEISRDVPPARTPEAAEELAWLDVEVLDVHGNPRAGSVVTVLHNGAAIASKTVEREGVLHFGGLPRADDYEVLIEPPAHSCDSDAIAEAEDPDLEPVRC
jgi:hypothetical protein